jgi:hypothetical protein
MIEYVDDFGVSHKKSLKIQTLPAVLNEPQFATSGMALPWVVARQNRQTLMPQS